MVFYQKLTVNLFLFLKVNYRGINMIASCSDVY